MSTNNGTQKKTYAQVAASPPQSEDGTGSETGEGGESHGKIQQNDEEALTSSTTKSGNIKSSMGSEPKISNPVDKASEEFIPKKRTSMLTNKENGAKDKHSSDLPALNDEMEQKRLLRRRVFAFAGGAVVGLAVVGAIWWAVRRRPTSPSVGG
ncbi:hypothetical protein GPALN_005378 [Globodera pallida]|nr:hypothetical protein GPALN_005378 [Globodera pallida]